MQYLRFAVCLLMTVVTIEGARTISWSRLEKFLKLTKAQQAEDGPDRSGAAKLFYESPMVTPPPDKKGRFYYDLRSNSLNMDHDIYTWELKPEQRRYPDFGCSRDATLKITPPAGTRKMKIKLEFYLPWRTAFDLIADKDSTAAQSSDAEVISYSNHLFFAWTNSNGDRKAKLYRNRMVAVLYVTMKKGKVLIFDKKGFYKRNRKAGIFDGSSMMLGINHAIHNKFAGLSYLERRGIGLCVVDITLLPLPK